MDGWMDGYVDIGTDIPYTDLDIHIQHIQHIYTCIYADTRSHHGHSHTCLDAYIQSHTQTCMQECMDNDNHNHINIHCAGSITKNDSGIELE